MMKSRLCLQVQSFAGEYGEKDVFVGVPCVIGKNGVEEVVELSLNEREKEELKKSCDVIRGNIKMVEEKK